MNSQNYLQFNFHDGSYAKFPFIPTVSAANLANLISETVAARIALRDVKGMKTKKSAWSGRRFDLIVVIRGIDCSAEIGTQDWSSLNTDYKTMSEWVVNYARRIVKIKSVVDPVYATVSAN